MRKTGGMMFGVMDISRKTINELGDDLSNDILGSFIEDWLF